MHSCYVQELTRTESVSDRNTTPPPSSWTAHAKKKKGRRGRDLTAEGVDTGGPDLGKELDGRGSGGKDVSGACVLVSELEAGVGRGKLGDGSTAVGGGASGRPQEAEETLGV